MKPPICLGILLLVANLVSNAQEVDTHRKAAEEMIRTYEVKSNEERGRDLAETLLQAGLVQPEAIDRLSIKLGKLLSSDQFMDITSRTYLKHFTEEEMVSITESLKNPAMRKFISIRFEIVQESMSQIDALFDEFEITEELYSP